MRAEWHGKVDFAEVAEALSVTTEQIMAAISPHSEDVLVLFTPGDPNEYPPKVFSAQLKRDTDGVLVCISAPVYRPGWWEKITEEVEARLKQ